MLPSPFFANIRSHAINEFNSLYGRAVRSSWLAKILQRNNAPRSFVASSASGVQARRLPGVQCIPVEKIVGTIQRTTDFDKDFRPLKTHLRDRWANALLQLKTDGWQPILVHQLGENYFIKHGHHRVSVAKALGMMFIEAEVWEHTHSKPPRNPCNVKCEPVKRHAEAYSINS